MRKVVSHGLNLLCGTKFILMPIYTSLVLVSLLDYLTHILFLNTFEYFVRDIEGSWEGVCKDIQTEPGLLPENENEMMRHKHGECEATVKGRFMILLMLPTRIQKLT